jgi:NADPH2:quinone reductase
MRAVVVDRFAPDGVARLGWAPVPEPGPGQIRVRVAYASVNPADWKCQTGWMLGFEQFRPSLPFGLGFDGAGVVDELGPGAAAREVGDRVFLRVNQMAGQHGSFAEYVCVAVADTAPIPATVNLLPAATVPVAGVTAWQSVAKYAAVQAGQQVLINGGAGGVGSYAIQFAVVAGARVAATSGPTNLDYLRELGCERAVDYRSENLCVAMAEWAPGGVDKLIDTVNTAGVADATTIVRPGGAIIAVMTLGEPAPYPAGELDARGVRFVDATVRRDEAAADMVVIGGLLADGTVSPPAIELLPLAQAPAALDRVRAGHVRGKLVLEIAPGP